MDLPLIPRDGRQSGAALAIARGTGRLLARHGFAPTPELALPNGRRADLAAIDARGTIWIIEIKSGVADFQADHKWGDYRLFCDRLFFAVAPDFPHALLPPDTGLIIADVHDGDMLREAPEHRLAAPTRKAVTLAIARAAALRLHQALDPEARLPLF